MDMAVIPPSVSASRLWYSHKSGWPLGIGAVAAVAFLVAWAMAWGHRPTPFLHDEFSNLLVADTLRHGRLANPSPEIWQPFQSFHVLVRPSYASKYPLGPGALLALGSILGGSPVVGIWFGAALCAAAVTWAAAGCLPRRWALLAGLLLALHPNVHREWSLSFVNGYLTAASGALVAGAALRLRRGQRLIDGLALGLGVSGLALTRPFEGLLFTGTAAVLLLVWWRGTPLVDQVKRAARICAVATWPVAATLALIAAHNLATTGKAMQLAYQAHEAKYAVAPLSIFQAEKVPEMNQWLAEVPPTFVKFHYGWSLESYRKRNHWAGWCGAVAERLYVVAHFWGWIFCLIAVAFLARERKAFRLLAAAVAVAMLLGTFVPWYFPHYFAPSLVWLVILTAVGLYGLIKRVATDRTSVRLCMGTLLVLQAVLMVGEIARTIARPYNWSDQRQWLVDDLTRAGGEHLILVRYHDRHNVHHEWVYNGADLETAPVLWARSWRRDLDDRLIAHHPQRQVWLLELDEADRPKLQKYSCSARQLSLSGP